MCALPSKYCYHTSDLLFARVTDNILSIVNILESFLPMLALDMMSPNASKKQPEDCRDRVNRTSGSRLCYNSFQIRYKSRHAIKWSNPKKPATQESTKDPTVDDRRRQNKLLNELLIRVKITREWFVTSFECSNQRRQYSTIALPTISKPARRASWRRMSTLEPSRCKVPKPMAWFEIALQAEVQERRRDDGSTASRHTRRCE